MHIGSKNKKRDLLCPRPNPPTVAQIEQDLERAAPSDPVFSILEDSDQDSGRHPDSDQDSGRHPDSNQGSGRHPDSDQDSGRHPDSDVEFKYQQSRRYLELNERLCEVKGQLLRQTEGLRAAGGRLEHDVAEVKSGLVVPLTNTPVSPLQNAASVPMGGTGGLTGSGDHAVTEEPQV